MIIPPLRPTIWEILLSSVIVVANLIAGDSEKKEKEDKVKKER